MEKRKSQRHPSLENEVTISVVVLYLMIAFVMIVVHFMQPADQQTMTSSTSPSHNKQSVHTPLAK
jgi:hypothetical protein